MTQTAVDYLIEQIQIDQYSEAKSPVEWLQVFETARAKEKQQQIDFATDFARDYIGFTSVCTDANDLGPAAHYYNQKHSK